MSVTSGAVVPAIIQKARILDVDIASYSLTIATEFAKKPMTGISFATPYQHFVNGEGIYFMPEVGSLCWLCEPSDGCMPFVLAWASGQNEADFTSMKRQLNPGDIYLGTRDENFLILRRGGVVQVGATAICQRMFLPVNNTIKDFCENYGLHTLGGDLEWTIKREESTTDGTRPALLSLYAKEFANDAKPIAELEIGSHDGDEKTILSLIIRDKGGGAEKISLLMDKDGNVIWTVKKDFTLKVEGDHFTDITGQMDLKVGKTLTAYAKDNINVTTDKNATLSAKQVTLDAPDTKMTGTTHANGGVAVALSDPLISWLTSHTHAVTSAPGTTGGPDLAPPGAIASKKLFSS